MSNRKEPYASEAESAAVIAPYTLSAAEKKLHDMMDERGAWEQGAETYPALYQIAIELLEREAQVVQSTTENSSAVEQLAPQGCLRCNTPKKCALYGCSPLAWPSEQPAQPQQACHSNSAESEEQNSLTLTDGAQTQQQQEPVMYDKTEMNFFAQNLYDQKMREGKRGHYESMFHVIHQCIKKVAPAQPQQEFPLRGILASELKCWHRLTEDEAQNLLAFVQNMPSKPPTASQENRNEHTTRGPADC